MTEKKKNRERPVTIIRRNQKMKADKRTWDYNEHGKFDYMIEISD